MLSSGTGKFSSSWGVGRRCGREKKTKREVEEEGEDEEDKEE